MRAPTPVFLICLLCGSVLAGCGGEQQHPNRPITLICPWAAGGGTDRVSRQIAAHLELELGVPVNVVNATGGKGVTGHSRGINARPDGYTIAMLTLELNMMHWSGLTDLTHHDCTLLMSLNEDYAALMVRKDAPWQNIGELEKQIRDNPKQLKASGTASGGAWHLALAGWLTAAQLEADDVVWISSTGANPSLQELISGGVDMVCCSLPEAAPLLNAGEVRALGVMAPGPVRGYEHVATFGDQQRDWSLGGWRGLAVPQGTPGEVVDRLVAALERIVAGRTQIVSRTRGDTGDTLRQSFPQFMESAGFDHTARPPDEFRRFLEQTDQKFGQLLTSDALKTVNQDRYSPLGFPGALMGLLAATLVGLGVRAMVQSPSELSTQPARVAPDQPANVVAFALVIVFVVVYSLAAETVGFVTLAAALLFALLIWMGNRWWVSAAIALAVVPAAYQLFAGLLRVPLPRGWWGW